MASSSVAPSTTTTSTVDYKNERDVVDAYTRLRQELSSLVDRVSDLESQLAEHALVAKTMRPMEKGRKAYRLVSLTKEEEREIKVDQTKTMASTFFSSA